MDLISLIPLFFLVVVLTVVALLADRSRRKDSEARKPVVIRLDPVLEQRLDTLAAQTGYTKAHFICELLENGIEDLEERYQASIGG